MITRAKASVFKPKVYIGATNKLMKTNMPPNVTITLFNPGWTITMKKEINKLAENQNFNFSALLS